MNAPSHLLLGALAGTLTAQTLDMPLGMVLVAAPAGAVAGLLPDLDHPGSTLGQALPRLWHRLTPGHRGVTHSLVWTAAAGLALAALSGWAGLQTAAAVQVGWIIIAGCLSHLLADGVTERGCPYLWPLTSYRFRLPQLIAVKTGGWAEQVIVAATMTAGGVRVTGQWNLVWQLIITRGRW